MGKMVKLLEEAALLLSPVGIPNQYNDELMCCRDETRSLYKSHTQGKENRILSSSSKNISLYY